MEADLIPAVAYYRMSDDRQVGSVSAQREAVVAYAAKHGFRIIREYIDEGISGDDTERRLEFQRMLRDAREKGDFQAVLCWDQDRFGRFDPLEAGYWVKPLRDAGIYLETVAAGRVRWDDFAGRIIYAVQQEGKHAFLRDLSRNVTRGMLAKARQGLWLGGPVPYGYALHDKKLVPGDPVKVAVVRRIFRTYADGLTSLGELAKQLNVEGVPSPAGGMWHKTAIEKILVRPHYCGDMAWNRRHDGKYHEVVGGEIKATTGKRRKANYRNPEPDWVLFPNTHEPLIDRETFARAGQRLVAQRTATSPKGPNGNFVFSGLVFCMECGSPMHGCTNVRQVTKTRCGNPTTPREYRYQRYICGRYNSFGTAGCHCNTITERQLKHAVARRLQQDFLNPGNLAKLREELRRQLEPPRKEAAAVQPRQLRRSLDDLDEKISQGAERLLTMPASLTDVLAAKVEEWQTERERLRAELEALAGRPASPKRDVEAAVEDAIGWLGRLGELLRTADPAHLHAVVVELVARIECWFRQVPYGQKGRLRSDLTRGLIRLRPDLKVSRLVPQGNPLGTSLDTLSIPFTAEDLGAA